MHICAYCKQRFRNFNLPIWDILHEFALKCPYEHLLTYVSIFGSSWIFWESWIEPCSWCWDEMNNSQKYLKVHQYTATATTWILLVGSDPLCRMHVHDGFWSWTQLKFHQPSTYSKIWLLFCLISSSPIIPRGWTQFVQKH